MRTKWQWLVGVLFLGVLEGGAGLAAAGPLPPPPPLPPLAPSLTDLCLGAKVALVESRAATARYQVAANGTVEVRDAAARAATISFVGSDPLAVRVAVASLAAIKAALSQGTPPSPDWIACSTVDAGQVYELSPAPAGVMTVQLFGLVEESAGECALGETSPACRFAELRPSRVAALVEQAKPFETAAFDVREGIEGLLQEVVDLHPLVTSQSVLRSGLEAKAKALEAMQSCKTAAGDQKPLQKGKLDLEAPLCELYGNRAEALQKGLTAIAKALGTTADVATAQALARGLKVEQPEQKAKDSYCKTIVPQLRWHAAKSEQRLLAKVELPLVPPGDLVNAVAGSGVALVEDRDLARGVGVLITDVPVDQHLVIFGSAVSGGAPSGPIGPIGQLLSAALASKPLAQLLATALNTSGFNTILPPGDEPNALKEDAWAFSMACDREQSPRKVRLDPSVPPTAAVGSLAMVFEPPPARALFQVVVARPADAPASDAKPAADKPPLPLNTITITPSPSSWLLAAELGASLGQRVLEGTPGLEAVSSATGAPDAVYQLRAPQDPRNAMSTSFLLGYNLHHFLAAAGPSVVIGTSAAVFTQWNLRVGYEFTPGLFVTLGPSVRAIPAAIDFAPGAYLTLPAGAAAPQVRTRQTWEPLFSLGLAVDLSVFSDAGAKLIGTITGKGN